FSIVGIFARAAAPEWLAFGGGVEGAAADDEGGGAVDEGADGGVGTGEGKEFTGAVDVDGGEGRRGVLVVVYGRAGRVEIAVGERAVKRVESDASEVMSQV
ncbi:hypothetical protein MMC11_000905, partial [Xylographa trunciseda]|nr:hypothetical protein [Xylographa trunciseda]